MKKKGFTLIELLVVVAIIALLLTIVMPALRKAKEIAAAAVCMANDSSASKAWLLYCEDNKGRLMDGDAPEIASGYETFTISGSQVTVWCFVAAPQNAAGAVINTSVGDQVRGFAKGALWSYMGGAAKAYNCPADKRWIKPPTDLAHAVGGSTIGGYRTFSMGGVLSQWLLSGTSVTGEAKYVVTKWSQFTNPSGKFVWLEEWDPRGWNHRTWNIHLIEVRWFDPLAMTHNGASTFGYADGHADRYKWTGPVTKSYFNPENQTAWVVNSCPPLADKKDIDDYNWFVQHYIPGRK